MKISIIGTHGIPARHGGFETFAAHLAKACASAGIKIAVINQKNNPIIPCPESVEIITSSYNKSSNPLSFYKDSLKIINFKNLVIKQLKTLSKQMQKM